MTPRARMPAALLLALALAGPALAQGTAPTQGVTQPQTQPVPQAGPPVPPAASLGDGRPRTDQGGGAADTSPGTTSSLPLPPQGQATPPPRR